MKMKYVIPVLIAGAVGIGLLNAPTVQADDETCPYRAERRQVRQSQYEDRLNQLVTEGKITAEQKQLILNKHQEIQSQRQAQIGDWTNKIPEERRAASEAQRQAMSEWAEQNGIDPQNLFGAGYGMRGGRQGQGF